MVYYSAMKKNEILPFSTWMDLEEIMLGEINPRMANTVWFSLYVKSKKQRNKQNQKQTHNFREQTYGGQREAGWEDRHNGWREVGGKFPVTEWIILWAERYSMEYSQWYCNSERW